MARRSMPGTHKLTLIPWHVAQRLTANHDQFQVQQMHRPPLDERLRSIEELVVIDCDVTHSRSVCVPFEP
jgi:hypothetical protein